MIIVEGYIKQFEKNLYLGWIPKFKGLVVEGSSFDEIKKELLTSLKVKIAYDYDLEVSDLETKEIESLADIHVQKIEDQKNYKLQLTL